MLTIVLDFLLVAFSCFGYLLKPHLSRALSGRVGARLRRFWRRARALFAGLVRRPLNCWRRWRLRHLSDHEVGLLRLGREIEHFGETLDANGDQDNEQQDTEEDEEGSQEEAVAVAVADGSANGAARGGVDAPAGPNSRAKINNDRETTRRSSPAKSLEASPALILEAASAYYSNKLSPGSSWSSELSPSDDSSSVGAKGATTAAETGPLEFYFVARDNPIVCSINWMNSDLICFGREARAGDKNCSLSSVAGLANELGQGPKGGEKGGDLAGTSVGHAPIDQHEGKLGPVPKQAGKTSVIGGASSRDGHAGNTEGDADVTEPEQIVDQDGGAGLASGEIRPRAAPAKAAAAARSSGGAHDAAREAACKNKNKEEDIEEDIEEDNNNNKGPHQMRNRHHNCNSSRGKYLNETHNNSKRVLSRASDNNHGDATKGGRRGSRDQVDDEAGSGKLDDGLGRQQQRQKHGLGGPIETAATLVDADSVNGGSIVSVRRIWSSQCNGTTKRELILIQQQQQHQQLAPSGRSPAKDPLPATISRTFCLAELYSHAQLLRFDARSSLIFYFIQLYPNELAPLFGLISRLLELAGLIEPSGYCCRRLSQRKTGTRSSGMRSGNTDDGHHDEDERRWLELVGWDLGVDSRKSADENDADKLLARQLASQQLQATSGRLIDRYALVLMIVAHLERERSSSANKTLASAAAKSNEQIRLASSLASFFECYSSCAKLANRDGGRQAAPLVLVHSREAAKSGPKATSNKHAKMEIEFVTGTTNAAAAAPFVHLVADRTRSTLVVLDPIEFRLNNSLAPNCLEPGNKLELAHAQWATFNLTSRLEVWSDICQLFADYHALITRQPNPTEAQVGAGTISGDDDDGGRGTNARANTLNELFELAERSRSKQRHGRDLSEQIEQIWSPKQGQQQPQTGTFAYHRLDDSRGGATAGRTAGNQSGSLIRRSLSKLNKLRQNKLIKSLFYLFLFVAFRFAVLSFLQGLQRDLMYEARDDFIALKRMIFPGGLKMVDDGDDDDQDGISILMRDEQKEARRAEANKRRETAKTAQSNPNMNPLSTNDDQGHEGVSAEAEEVNKVMEALLTGLFSQAFGNEGAGEMANMDPQKLAEMMKMLTAPEGNDGGGDDEDQGDQDDVQFDEQEFAKMLEEMQLLTGGDKGGGEGGGLKLNMAGLADLMGDGAADHESGGVFQSEQMANIDSDFDEEADDYDEQIDGSDDGHEDGDDRSVPPGMTEQASTGTSDEL